MDEGLRRRGLLLAAAALIPGMPGRQTADDHPDSPWSQKQAWRMNGEARQTIRLLAEGEPVEVVVTGTRPVWKLELDGKSSLLQGKWLDHRQLELQLDGERLRVSVLSAKNSLAINCFADEWLFNLPVNDASGESAAAGAGRLLAPMPGSIIALSVAVGDTVQPGQTLMVLEAMKMEHAIVASVEAKVSQIAFGPGDQVEEGQVLILLE